MSLYILIIDAKLNAYLYVIYKLLTQQKVVVISSIGRWLAHWNVREAFSVQSTVMVS